MTDLSSAVKRDRLLRSISVIECQQAKVQLSQLIAAVSSTLHVQWGPTPPHDLQVQVHLARRMPRLTSQASKAS